MLYYLSQKPNQLVQMDSQGCAVIVLPVIGLLLGIVILGFIAYTVLEVAIVILDCDGPGLADSGRG